MYQHACLMDHDEKFSICRILNVILTPNKTCKTKLQSCASHFTVILGLYRYDW